MSKGFIVGNSGGDVDYSISCAYPEGSILTCKDEAETIELKANNTSGLWIFDLPFKGKWTVTSTDPAAPTNTASETVEITTEGQSVSVELRYRLYLYKAGDECESVTGGWSISNNTNASTAVFTNSGGTLTVKQPAAYDLKIAINQAVSFANYDMLVVVATKATGDYKHVRVGTVRAPGSNNSLVVTTINVGEIVSDISALNDSYFVALGVAGSEIQVSEVYLA